MKKCQKTLILVFEVIVQPPKTHFLTFSSETKIMKISHSATRSNDFPIGLKGFLIFDLFGIDVTDDDERKERYMHFCFNLGLSEGH